MPSTPANSTAPPTGWSTTVPGGTDTLWSVKGNHAAGSTTYVWGQVERSNSEGNLEGDLTAEPASVVQWTSTEGHIYSPTGTYQDVTVTFNDGITKNSCIIRVSYSNIAFSNSDFISSIVENTESDNAFSIAGMSPAVGSTPKFATATVTHTASGLTIDISGIVSQIDLSGAGK